MTEKRFKIVDEEFISYYGGTGHKISNGECGFWLWHSKTESQKVCDRLNDLLDENEELKNGNKNLTGSRRELIEAINYYNKVIGGLTEENEQLRSQLDTILKID